MRPVKTILIEPNAILEKGLSLLLHEQEGIELLATHHQISAVENANWTKARVVITDLVKESDFEEIKAIRKRFRRLKIIVFSSEKQLFENYLFVTLNNYLVNAFITKQVKFEQLIDTVKYALALPVKEVYMMENVRQQLFGEEEANPVHFSARELNVLRLLGNGRTIKETADIMNLSTRTIETHRRRMIDRIGAKNIIAVLVYALQKKYLKIDMFNVLEHQFSTVRLASNLKVC